jgi:hypothetical protein
MTPEARPLETMKMTNAIGELQVKKCVECKTRTVLMARIGGRLYPLCVEHLRQAQKAAGGE